tara:strand:+ start:2514 stop:3077 length:564 start_codon:yes stop_codon:yes gene_type:complete
MNHKEIEYKYWASISKEELSDRLDNVCSNMDQDLEISDMIYVVSCDDYYTRPNGDGKDFIRFRKGGGTFELTLKRKENENVVRKEINLDLSGNNDSSVVEFLSLIGYTKSFQVYKEAWIWHTPKCDISFYTLSDGRNVIELESTNYSTTKEGLDIIKTWEEMLGLQSQSKESRSLYEIFTEETINGQ